MRSTGLQRVNLINGGAEGEFFFGSLGATYFKESLFSAGELF
jgi:hypothetical protein